MEERKSDIQEKTIETIYGGGAILMLILNLAIYFLPIPIIIHGVKKTGGEGGAFAAYLIGAIIIFIGAIIFSLGFQIIKPKEARVYTLFGDYYGTLSKTGYHWFNPFTSAYINPAYQAKKMTTAESSTEESEAVELNKSISLKTHTIINQKQKVNDAMGNPVIIGAAVIWHIEDPTAAVFNVENYHEFLSVQCDSMVRNTARSYPYDIFGENDDDEEENEKTLRGSINSISKDMRDELQKRVAKAGIVIEEVRITDLAYAEEIAAAMLQRQQASAVIAARRKIVDGAVGMVKMAIEDLDQDELVVLDDERKAAMVSNLLVVLCGNKDAQPVVNSGSIY